MLISAKVTDCKFKSESRNSLHVKPQYENTKVDCIPKLYLPMLFTLSKFDF